MNKLDEIYLNYLKNVGGRASINSISYGTGITKTEILREIEPGLLYKKNDQYFLER